MVSSRLALPPFAVCLHAAASFLRPKAAFFACTTGSWTAKIAPRMRVTFELTFWDPKSKKLLERGIEGTLGASIFAPTARDLGPSFANPGSRWPCARVPCTLCTPYCYATDSRFTLHQLTGKITENSGSKVNKTKTKIGQHGPRDKWDDTNAATVSHIVTSRQSVI